MRLAATAWDFRTFDVAEAPGGNAVTGEELMAIAATIRDAALYLARYGWIQGSYFDQSCGLFVGSGLSRCSSSQST
jgi:hypothetical protein